MVNCKRKIWFDVKNTIINVVLEVMSPNRCQKCGDWGEVLCPCCKKYLEVTNPGYVIDGINGFERIMVGGVKEGILSEMVKNYKYKSQRNLAEILAWKIRTLILKRVEDVEKIALVPLPTIRKHMRERGFDHMKYLSEFLRGEIEVQQILVRTNKTVQVGKDAIVRQQQAKNAYAVRNGVKIDEEALYVLFDDVWTTGASMRATQKVLKEAGAKKIDALLIVSNDYIEK